MVAQCWGPAIADSIESTLLVVIAKRGYVRPLAVNYFGNGPVVNYDNSY